MTLVCKNGVHWLSPDAKKMLLYEFYDECGGLYFSPSSFCRYSNPVLIFTSYYTHIVVAVVLSVLTTIWFETASIIRKKTYQVSIFFIERWHCYLQITKCIGVVFVDYFSHWGCGITYRHIRIKGWVCYYYILYLIFFLKSGYCVHRLYYICLECGVGFKVDYKPFGPIHIHRR